MRFFIVNCNEKSFGGLLTANGQVIALYSIGIYLKISKVYDCNVIYLDFFVAYWLHSYECFQFNEHVEK